MTVDTGCKIRNQFQDTGLYCTTGHLCLLWLFSNSRPNVQPADQIQRFYPLAPAARRRLLLSATAQEADLPRSVASNVSDPQGWVRDCP